MLQREKHQIVYRLRLANRTHSQTEIDLWKQNCEFIPFEIVYKMAIISILAWQRRPINTTDDFIKFKLKFEFDNKFMAFFHLTDENHESHENPKLIRNAEFGIFRISEVELWINEIYYIEMFACVSFMARAKQQQRRKNDGKRYE